jgi:RHH-type transcriptional regulator, rel operon repressor / antitoxin RelB
MSTAISIRLPKDLSDDLDKLAKAIDRPKTYLVREAIETYVEEYGDYRMALDRLLDKDDEIVGGSELRQRLGI